MTVMQNVVYGSGRSSKTGEVKQIAEEVMKSFRIGHLADRRPSELSGGESQRASVARALVSAITFDEMPRPLLLLDEPLAGLDIAVRDEMIAALRQWTTRWKIPVLSVTHTLGEAFQLSAEVIKISNGTVIEQGPVERVLEGERQQLLKQLSGA
jgi:molybdate transport system ATP-binding protein